MTSDETKAATTRDRTFKVLGPAKELRDSAALARKAIRGKISREEWTENGQQPTSVWRVFRPSY